MKSKGHLAFHVVQVFKIKQRKRKLSKKYGYKQKRAMGYSVQNLFKKTANWDLGLLREVWP